MKLFLAIAFDHDPNSFELRDKHRDEHRVYVRSNDRAIRLVGPMLDDDNGQRGSFYVFEAESADEVRAWFEKEPFYRGGVYRELIIRAFFVGKNELPMQGWPDLG
jgi:uncharacterized protein YciI